MKILIVAGAGTSVELGVPAMAGLAEEFIEHSRQWNVDPDLVGKLLDQVLDIEKLIEEVDRICTAKASLEALGSTSIEFERFDKVRAEVEWFIQHAAERIVPREAALMWAGVLRAARQHHLTLVTTNYDRAIELAANSEDIDINDGFGAFDHRETARWLGFGQSGAQTTLVKLHGSTDWYSESATGNPIKLRHPMPLFGRALLQLNDGNQLGTALILPSREKLLTRDPYPRLSQMFLNAVDCCEIAVIVGTSLRDHHLRTAVQAVSNRVPTFIVNRSGSAMGIANARGIRQTASSFLIGTLPAALATNDPVKWLARQNDASAGNSTGALNALGTAPDPNADTFLRCQALDCLESQGASLEIKWMRELLSCSNSHVARYGLGLIPQSPYRDELMGIAESSSHASGDAAFAEDLKMLRTMREEQS